MTNFHIFIIPLHYFQGALIWLRILKEIMKQVALKDFLEKAQRYIQYYHDN